MDLKTPAEKIHSKLYRGYPQFIEVEAIESLKTGGKYNA